MQLCLFVVLSVYSENAFSALGDAIAGRGGLCKRNGRDFDLVCVG